MYIKKFYDMEASDVASGSSEATPTSAEASVPQQGESIASIMAREGRKTGIDGEDINPIRLNNDGSWETKSTQAEAPAVPAKEDAPVGKEDKEQSASKSAEAEASVPEPQIEEESNEGASWLDAIKQQQPEEVLKALGFDEKTASFIKELKEIDPKMVNFLSTWKEKGDVSGYLNELGKDYSTMPAEDVMRHQLQLDYPKATEAQLEVLYKKEIVEKYNLSSYDEDEAAEGKMLLEAKADKYRDALVADQQSRLLPNAPDNSAMIRAEEQRVAEISQNIIKEFNDNPYTKEVFAKNAISIGEGNDKFTFPIDSKAISDLVINGDTNGELMFDKKVGANGEESFVPKAQHQLLVATVNKYGEKFITELAKHYKSLGSKAAIEPIDNAKPLETRNVSNASEEPKSVAGAMAKYGKMNSGGW